MSTETPNKTFIDPSARSSTDHLPLRGVSPEALDFEKVANHIDQAIRRGRYHGSENPIDYLQESQCVAAIDGTTYATTAGILCFGRNPQAIFPRAVVDLGHYRATEVDSNEVVHLEKNIGDTIFEQIERAELYLWTNTHHGMTLGDSARRIEIHEYPRAVIRELGVNMLVHRDYTRSGAAARVHLFRNRIEWVSPGGLPAGITVDNILDEQWSRNPVILSVLYEAGYVEAFGQGLNTVVNELRGAGMAEPGFRDTGASFIVTVYGRTIEGLGNGEITARMSDRQREIRAFIQKRGEVSSREVVALFANHVDSRSVRRDLQALTKAGVIIMQGWGRSARYYWADPQQQEDEEI